MGIESTETQLEVTETLMHTISAVDNASQGEQRTGQTSQSLLPAYLVAQARAAKEKAQRLADKADKGKLQVGVQNRMNGSGKDRQMNRRKRGRTPSPAE